MTGAYIHIPFCNVHCPYCDFNAYAGMDDLAPKYVDALLQEIEFIGDGSPVSTIFFGGGTPSRLPSVDLSRILQALRSSFDLDPNAEISLEANPEDVDGRGAGDLLEAGINRLSVGVQSLSREVLTMLGRSHDALQGLAALSAARQAGFESLNADLIFGTPGESLGDWRASLEGVIETGVTHVSCYALTVEEGTPLASWVGSGRFRSPDEDDQADKYELANDLLESNGFQRYEVSNWSRPGFECRHNLGYWDSGDYFGLGAGAHSHKKGRRSWNIKNPRSYIARVAAAKEGFEVLTSSQRIEEHAILRMRTAAGIDRPAFIDRWGVDPVEFWAAELQPLIFNELLQISASALRPTAKGMLLNGQIARALLSGEIERSLSTLDGGVLI